MPLESHSHPPEQGSREVIDSEVLLRAQSQEVRDIIEKDPILKSHLDKISNLREFFIALEANKSIFLQTDNTQAQRDFLVSSIKGLGYGQMTKDGREFGKLTEKEVDGLGDAEYDAYQKWKIAQLDATLINEERRYQENGAKTINLKEVDDRLLKIESTVDKAMGSLTPTGQAVIEKALQEAKKDTQNPAIDTLVKSGVALEEIQKSSKYDNYIRASVILGAEKELSRYIIAEKAGDFKDSLDSIRKLGIVPSHVDTANFASHIDARFPKTSATESAKDEIMRSMSTGNIANIYYDGKGEKYTLMDKDGKTSKEVYMSPPHVRIMRNGLTLEQEVPEKKGEEKRIDIESRWREAGTQSGESISIFVRDMSERDIMNGEHLDLIHSETYKSNYIILLGREPIEKRRESAEKLRTLYMQGRDARTANKDLYDRKYTELGDIVARLDKESLTEKAYRNLPEKTSLPMERFDTVATANLDWLIENKFDRIGRSANEVLSRIIAGINIGRNPTNQISLEGKVLDEGDQRILLESFRKIGGILSILTNNEGLSWLQKKIVIALQKTPSDPESIESLMKR